MTSGRSGMCWWNVGRIVPDSQHTSQCSNTLAGVLLYYVGLHIFFFEYQDTLNQCQTNGPWFYLRMKTWECRDNLQTKEQTLNGVGREFPSAFGHEQPVLRGRVSRCVCLCLHALASWLCTAVSNPLVRSAIETLLFLSKSGCKRSRQTRIPPSFQIWFSRLTAFWPAVEFGIWYCIT